MIMLGGDVFTLPNNCEPRVFNITVIFCANKFFDNIISDTTSKFVFLIYCPQVNNQHIHRRCKSWHAISGAINQGRVGEGNRVNGGRQHQVNI